jgi:hypothetical protein
MKRERRKQLRMMALEECASIIEAAIGTDLGIFSDGGITREEADLVESIMRQISDSLYARVGR